MTDILQPIPAVKSEVLCVSNTTPNKLNSFEKLMLKTVPPLISSLINHWCGTLKVVERINEESERRAVFEYNGAVYVTWHQRMLYFFHDYGKRNIIMMISRSKDGDYADSVARRLGFQSVRGSRVRDGHHAMLEIICRLKQGGRIAGMMADGPIGPPRKLKMGTVRIAQETGKPIIPMMYGARRRFVLKSWDRYIVPKPFSEVVTFHGNPIMVPADAGREECMVIRDEVEAVLNSMADTCDTYWGGLPVGKPGFDL